MDNGKWYVVKTKARQEWIASENLVRQGFEIYLPRLKIRKRRRNNWTDVIEPLFPGYVFIHIDIHRQSTAAVRSTRGAVGLVRFGLYPASVPDMLVTNLRQSADASTGLHHRDRSLFTKGDKVLIVEGAFKDVQGVFQDERGSNRSEILLEMLGKHHKVVIDNRYLDKMTA